jgi:hypothetical protein
LEEEEKMNGLTKKQAYESMEQGNKITHWYFSKDEYLWMDSSDNIRDEKGYYWKQKDWDDRSGGNWETGWGIWKDEE